MHAQLFNSSVRWKLKVTDKIKPVNIFCVVDLCAVFVQLQISGRGSHVGSLQCACRWSAMINATETGHDTLHPFISTFTLQFLDRWKTVGCLMLLHREKFFPTLCCLLHLADSWWPVCPCVCVWRNLQLQFPIKLIVQQRNIFLLLFKKEILLENSEGGCLCSFLFWTLNQ